MMTQPKTEQEIVAMREGGAMLGKVLEDVASKVKPGVTTKFLADEARATLDKLGGKPAFLGYYGFPDVLCVSLNDEVVHGIPSEKRIIKDGDIVSLDFGVLHKGMITDAAVSVIAGTPQPGDQKLLDMTRRSLEAAIDALSDGVKTGTIGAAVQEVLDKAGFGIVRDYVGHGVGHQLHEEPNIPNYGIENQGPMLHAGMTIAIEPMSTKGNYDVYVARDNWTVCTKDKSRSAHFEQTILITSDGAEVLTPLP
jgi:methionyl aminopeptidase